MEKMSSQEGWIYSLLEFVQYQVIIYPCRASQNIETLSEETFSQKQAPSPLFQVGKLFNAMRAIMKSLSYTCSLQ